MFAAAALVGLLSACDAGAPASYRFTRFAMETVVEYTIIADSPTRAREAMLDAHAELERVARLLWEEDPNSEIYRSLHDGAAMSSETYAFLERVRTYHRTTGGAFDPTIKPVLDLYRFGEASPEPPADEAILDVLHLVGAERLQLDPDGRTLVAQPQALRLAVGGVAKGYAVDRAVAILREHGIGSALVNAGGDLYAMGTRNGAPWRVGVRDAGEAGALIAVLEVSDEAVATSGDYERFFEFDGVRYHHLLDPATGRPASGVRSATVLAPSAEQADALATGFFVMGPHRALEATSSLPRVETVVVDATGRVLHSRGVAARARFAQRHATRRG